MALATPVQCPTYPGVPEYHTPEKLRRPLGISLLPGARLRFYFGAFYAVAWARRKAVNGLFDAAALVEASRKVARFAEWGGAHIHLTGTDVLRDTPGPVVVIGNHMSTLETFLLPAIIGTFKPLGFVVKDSLLTHRLFGPIMRSVRTVAVTRANPRQDLQAVLEGGTALLQNGVSLCIFPQATRSFEFDESRFNSLGVKLARRADVPVVPVALRTDFWGNGRWIKDFGPINPKLPVRIAFGEALSPALRPAEVQAKVVAFVREHLLAWGVPCRTADLRPKPDAATINTL